MSHKLRVTQSGRGRRIRFNLGQFQHKFPVRLPEETIVLNATLFPSYMTLGTSSICVNCVVGNIIIFYLIYNNGLAHQPDVNMTLL